MSYLLAPFAFALGIVLTTQIATNKQLGEALDNFYIPAFVNMAVGLLATATLAYFLTEYLPTREAARSAPWYSWLAGGLLGTAYVTGNIVLAPKLGAAALVGLVVAGQIVFSVLLDHFGWIGFEQHTAGLARIAGCVLLLAGVFLVSRY